MSDSRGSENNYQGNLNKEDLLGILDLKLQKYNQKKERFLDKLLRQIYRKKYQNQGDEVKT